MGRYNTMMDSHQRSTVGGGTKALGIIGTTLGGIAVAGMASNGCGRSCNNGILGNLFGGNNACYVDEKEFAWAQAFNAESAKVAKLEAERYTDQVGLELYTQQVNDLKDLTAYVNANFRELDKIVSANDKVAFTAIAENKTDIALNKQASDYQFLLTDRKIDCNAKEIRSYVDGTFVAGELIMPLDKICPEAQPKCQDVQLVSLISQAVQAATSTK